jgi:hypothetical protein
MEKRMKKNSAAAAATFRFWWNHLKERGRETFVVTAHHHFHQRRLLYVHTTRVMRYVVLLKRIHLSLSLSLSKLFYFIHKIIIILLRFPTSQRFHDALRGRWPRRFLIRSEHIPNRWDAHR